MVRSLLFTISLLCSLGVLGCREQASVADALPAKSRIIVLLPETIKGALDPRLNTRAWTGKIIALMYEGLVSIEQASLAPEPALAERIDQPTPTTYEIWLRPNARFADGSPVTAEDVRATYESVQREALGSPLRSAYARIQRIEVLGEKHLRMTLDGPHAPFITDLSLGIVPARLMGPDGRLTGAPLGAGPYQLYTRPSASEVVLKRSEHYWRGQPRTPYLVFRTVRDQNTMLLALLGGAADLVQNAVTPLMAKAMKDRPGLALDAAPGVSYAYLAFNLRDPALRDVRVRHAFAHAIDVERLILHKLGGVARAATGMLPQGHWAYSGEVARYPFSPARAEALLDEAGFKRPADGGPRLSISLKVSTDKFRRNLARLIAADLEAVGVAVKVEAFESGTLLADVKSGNFQTFMLQWPDPSEPHLYNWLFHSDRIPSAAEPDRGGNRPGYANPEVDKLIEEGRVAPNREARRAAYARLQAILAEDLPYLSLWHEDVLVLRRRSLEGYVPLPHASLHGLWKAGFSEEP